MNSGPKVLGRPLSRLLIASAIAATLPAYADDTNEIDKLRAQIQELDQRLRILDRKQEIVNEDVAAKQKAAAIVTASDKGFGIKSADGQFEYKLRGLVQFDYRDIGGSSPDSSKIYDGFLARRIRPTFEGTVFGKYGFRFTPEFAESGDGSDTSGVKQNKTRVIDAYLDTRFDPAYSVRFGKFKPFVGLERMQSGSDIKFIERSYVSNNILPNRDLGISLFGETPDKKLSYAVGLFNGVKDGGENFTTQDDNQAKDLAARVFATPFINTDHALAGLGFGIAGTWSNSSTNTLSSYKTPGQAYNFFAYKSGTTANGTRERIAPQAYYYRGPLGVIAEYASVKQDIIKGAATATSTNSAWQVATSYLLTGEDASFKGVKPYNPFRSGVDGGWGALELVARYQENNIDRDLVAATFIDTGKGYARAAKTWGVGVNWYLNESSRFSLNLERTKFSDITTGTVLLGDTENFAVARYQLAF